MTVEDFLPYELIYQDLIFEPTVMNSSTLDQEKRSAVLINIEVNLVTPSLCGINSCIVYQTEVNKDPSYASSYQSRCVVCMND